MRKSGAVITGRGQFFSARKRSASVSIRKPFRTDSLSTEFGEPEREFSLTILTSISKNRTGLLFARCDIRKTTRS
jgi:hypothetical protein